MTIAPTFLYPTPARRALLADVAAGRVFRDAAGEDYVSGERKVSVAVRELEAAGWVELGAFPGQDVESTGELALWAPTPYGRVIAEVRVLDFGVEASPQMVAEVGDPDEPRVLGHVLHMPDAPASARWQINIGAIFSVVRTRRAAWGELWHRACIAYAAQAPISQP